MILSSVSRKSLQFYILLVNIVSHTPHKSSGYLAFESVVGLFLTEWPLD